MDVASRDLRAELLHLAHDPTLPPRAVVERAEAYFDFVTGKSAQTPRQVIDAALDAADVR